jgi:hypothetical protein
MRPGRLLVQSLRVHRDFRREISSVRGRCRQPRKNNRREEFPAPGAGLIAGRGRESRKSSDESAQNAGFRAVKGRVAASQARMKPTGSDDVVQLNEQGRRKKWLKTR